MNNTVTWWERLMTEFAAVFYTDDGFQRFLTKHKLKISEQLTAIRRTD